MFAYILEREYVRFLNVQEDVLLRIMEITAASGTRLALPSQINYLDRARLRRENIDDSRPPANIRNSSPH